VPYSAYPPEVFEGIARWSAPPYRHSLVQKWIPAMPHVEKKLREGGTGADVGCGQGLVSILLAKAFPKSRFYGYDAHGPSIERARAAAKSAGVADRALFEVVDGARIPAKGFDLITTFDVLHDSADPLAIVRSARAALAPDGSADINEAMVRGWSEEAGFTRFAKLPFDDPSMGLYEMRS
jgi:2-polyprenyl-3-methyl-5-hydroxy-6-metoxy-1,4-benzoquinol methylase